VLVPELNYNELLIQRGDEAAAEWAKMIALPEGEEREKIVQGLRDYCELDTRAMVEIWRMLSEE